MHYIILFTLLTASVLAKEDEYYSFSQIMGSNSGSAFSLSGEGRITGVRVWENYYIYGVQLKYGDIWSGMVGIASGTLLEIKLDDDEAIIEISGKYSYYIQWLVFTTSKGRSLYAGNNPSGTTFNMYPEHKGAELRLISGTINGPITGIAAHWGLVSDSSEESGH